MTEIKTPELAKPNVIPSRRDMLKGATVQIGRAHV